MRAHVAMLAMNARLQRDNCIGAAECEQLVPALKGWAVSLRYLALVRSVCVRDSAEEFCVRVQCVMVCDCVDVSH